MSGLGVGGNPIKYFLCECIFIFIPMDPHYGYSGINRQRWRMILIQFLRMCVCEILYFGRIFPVVGGTE